MKSYASLFGHNSAHSWQQLFIPLGVTWADDRKARTFCLSSVIHLRRCEGGSLKKWTELIKSHWEFSFWISQSIKIFIIVLNYHLQCFTFVSLLSDYLLHITTISLSCVTSTNKPVSIQKDECTLSGPTESTKILEFKLLNFEQQIPLHFSLQPVSGNVSMLLTENYIWKREVGLGLGFVSNFSFTDKCECNSSIKKSEIFWCFVFG